MTVKEKRGVYPIYCGQCNRYLADVPKSTATYCPSCRKWSRLEPGQQPEANRTGTGPQTNYNGPGRRQK